MTTSHRFGIALIASIVIAGWVLPASAGDLPNSRLQKTETSLPIKTGIVYHPTRFAAVWPPNSTALWCNTRFPIILGITY